MNKHQQLIWKVDAALAFVDLKFWLLAWILVDLYRNTMLLGGLQHGKSMPVSEVLEWVWIENGKPYIFWIFLAAAADVFVKRAVKAMLE